MTHDAEQPQGAMQQLQRSHRRIEERLADLAATSDRIPEGDPQGDARAAFEDILGFFNRAVRRHEADEEESLFPRLAGHGELSGLIETLHAEHEAHRALIATFAKVLYDEGREGQRTQLDATARALRVAYEEHIRREESELFPAAVRLLTADDFTAMGQEMAARREGQRGQGGRHREGGG